MHCGSANLFVLSPTRVFGALVWVLALSTLQSGLVESAIQTPTDARDYVYQCDFGPDFDINFDEWPDHWRRQAGTGFPKYNPLSIQPDPLAPGNRVMELALDGGQAAIYSPVVQISQEYSYRLRYRIHLPPRAGHGCEAWASVTFFDEQQSVVQILPLKSFRATTGWVDFESPLLQAERPEIVSAVIGLHVRPTEAASLFGKVQFDDVSLQELPRLQLQLPNPLRVFTRAEEVKVTCRVSGVRKKDADLRLELYDERGQQLRTELRNLSDRTQTSKIALALDGTSQGYAMDQVEWQLVSDSAASAPASANGFYKLVITLLDRDTHPLVREVTFVVVPSEKTGRQETFGMSLPNAVIDFDQYVLGATLQQLGIGWIKLPIWLDHQDQIRNHKLGNLLQRLSRLEIDVIGVLDEPPARVYQQYWQHEQGIAALTSEASVFLEAIQPLLIEWSLRIDRWQIGSDQDTGIAEHLKTIDRMKIIKDQFRKFGEQTKIGLPWGWMMQQAPDTKQQWDFQSLVTHPPLTDEEFAYNYERVKEETTGENYIAIQPLNATDYTLPDRVQDLCRRMVMSKRLSVPRVFVPSPLDDECGLFTSDYNPTEMLLPWRTLAVQLNGATFLGSLYLPGGSTNFCFEKDQQTFMLIWNEQPTIERLFLGAEAKAESLWGRELALPIEEERHRIDVDPWPILVRNMDARIAKLRLSVQFDRGALDSISSLKQPLAISFENHFPHGVSGNITFSNDNLFAQETRINFQTGRGETVKSTVPVQIRSDALTGKQLIQLDFKLAGDDLPSFSVWRPLTVGAEDVEFAMRQQLDENGRFIILVTLINRSDVPVTYTMMVFVPERKPTSITFYEIAPGQNSKSIVIHNADHLKGQSLWMRATDGDGLRRMNYQLKVE